MYKYKRLNITISICKASNFIPILKKNKSVCYFLQQTDF